MKIKTRRIAMKCSLLVAAISGGCAEPPKPYGVEHRLYVPDSQKGQVWAVAPAVNLSGQKGVDPLLQADDLYMQLQQVKGLTVIPVNRVVETYAGLRIDSVQSPEQAALVCDVLGCDALIVPTITVYDPYDPPKVGASLQLFRKPREYVRPADIDPRELARAAAPRIGDAPGGPASVDPVFTQSVGMFDSANGSIRLSVQAYAAGRNDPVSPMGWHEYTMNMDRYCGFVYNALMIDLLRLPHEHIVAGTGVRGQAPVANAKELENE